MAKKSKVSKVMGEYKAGDLKIGTSNKKVKSRKQAVAIALDEARRAGEEVSPNIKKKKIKNRKQEIAVILKKKRGKK